MQKIPLRIREKINESPYFKKCIHNSGCDGRITIEHSFVYRGRQIPSIRDKISDELFLALLVPCCWKHNIDVRGEDKEWNKLITLMNVRAQGLWDELLEKYPKKDWQFEIERLLKKAKYH